MNRHLITDRLAVTCDWFFYEHDAESGQLISEAGPLRNDISPAGLQLAAAGIAAMPSPYLIIGDDLADGFVITQAHRQPVDYVLRTGADIRFRTVVAPGTATGTHQKASIFYGASDAEGSGTLFNLLRQPFSHSENTVLTVEARVRVAQGVA